MAERQPEEMPESSQNDRMRGESNAREQERNRGSLVGTEPTPDPEGRDHAPENCERGRDQPWLGGG